MLADFRNKKLIVPAVHTIRTAGGSFFVYSINMNQPPISIDEQVASLKGNGMTLDDNMAKLNLSQISYYRLKGYWWDMRKGNSSSRFLPHSAFETVLERYYFDKALRLILFDAIEFIEIALRTKMINYFSVDTANSLWYLDATLFNRQDYHNEHILRLKKEFDRSKDDAVKAYKNSCNWDANSICGDHPDAWLIFEYASLGTLSKIYTNIQHQHSMKSAIAKDFGLYKSNDFSNWLHSISIIRNIVAHHSRLWNRILSSTPIVPKSKNIAGLWIKSALSQNEKRMPYFVITNILYLCNSIRPQNDIKQRILSLFAKYPHIDIAKYGFVKNWMDEPIWAAVQGNGLK